VAALDDLATVGLFESLDEHDLAELADWFEVQTVGEGVNLTNEGASGYSFYVLAEGSAVVTAEGNEVARYGPGDFFGEMAIIGGSRRTATVTTTSPAKLLVMFGTEFRRLEQSHPAIAARLRTVMQQRGDELQRLRPDPADA
jgi:voltage-gated potassium channel